MTISLREDGGIDWEKYAQENSGRVGSMNSAIRMCRETAAHTRERCAKWHESMELTYLRLRDGAISIDVRTEYNRLAVEHRESAAAFRKMED